jgi:hypothetical protein
MYVVAMGTVKKVNDHHKCNKLQYLIFLVTSCKSAMRILKSIAFCQGQQLSTCAG